MDRKTQEELYAREMGSGRLIEQKEKKKSEGRCTCSVIDKSVGEHHRHGCPAYRTLPSGRRV